MKEEPLKKPPPHQKAAVKPKAEHSVWKNADAEAAEDPAGGDQDVKVTWPDISDRWNMTRVICE